MNRANYKVRKGSSSYLRAIVRVVMVWRRVYKEVVIAKLKERQEKIADLDEAIKLYTDVTKGWLIPAIKKPVLSMVSEPDLNFDFRDPTINEPTRDQRIMRLKVRIKGIIQDLATACDA